MTGTDMTLRHGAGSPLTLLVLPALFEEANRMRRFTVSVMRMLADRGIGTVLPDLPGMGENFTDLTHIAVGTWLERLSSIIDKHSLSISIRGGCLLDGLIAHRWRLAPEAGERLLRDMVRATAFGEGVTASEIEARAKAQQTRLAGNLIGPALYNSLMAAVPEGDAFVSRVEGPKLWRFAEAGDDPAYATAVADEIAAWVKTCDA